MRIAIRGGHTKTSYGAVGILDEYVEDRKVYKRVIELLKEYHTIIDCTPDDSYGNGEWNIGVQKANSSNIDLFFSIHFNSASGDPQGTEVCVYSLTGTAAEYGKKVCNNIASLGFINRGLKKRTDLAETANITKPSMIIEVCFVQKSDAALYKKVGVEKIARAIANAIDNRISLSGPTSNTTSNSTTSTSNELYRVRKSWSDSASQKGAFSVLENAISECKKHSGYKVFNNSGTQVYTELQVVDNEQITSSYKEVGKATVIVNKLNVRSNPNTKNSEVVASYSKGESFNYNEVHISNSYVWVSYISNSGHKRFVAVKDKKTNERYATCV